LGVTVTAAATTFKEGDCWAGGWGVTEYLQLDWMDDGTDGWMESFTTSSNILDILNTWAKFRSCVPSLHLRIMLETWKPSSLN
jgi:hypothetical protein